ncbi:MAG TPA: PQQ-dependent sugar dehydrogenase [Solirubrobacterales bacterium]
MLAAVAAATLGGSAIVAPQASGALQLQKVGDFAQPTYVAGTPAFKNLLYVVERRGTVRVLDRGHLQAKPFLDIRGRVSTDGERGLLSIAFDPHFGANHLLYAYYTNLQGNVEIDEFRAPSGTRVTASSRRQVIVIPHAGSLYHNGGQLQFGPDGYLYIGPGDGADGGYNARHLNVLLGKLLRINPHKQPGGPYAVPRSNPFVGRPGDRPEIYAYGLRNPFRFSFNPQADALAIGDVGQSSYEEIDYTKIQRAKGANFGWPKWEGNSIFNSGLTDPNPNPPAPTFPIFTYSHSIGCAIVGGYVVHDPGLPSLRGRYVYTDLCSGAIRSLVPRQGHGSDDRGTSLHLSNPSGFGQGPTGRIYVASLDGPVYRVKQVP